MTPLITPADLVTMGVIGTILGYALARAQAALARWLHTHRRNQLRKSALFRYRL